MSLVIQKFEPGGKTTQPRLYKRGNDDIDLDAYLRNAEAEFSYWLANSRLKDKEKQQVQKAYSQIIQGINDGTFTYKIGGGYNNSVGMSNLTKGFDAAGLAAGFLGNILRNQSVYKTPEEKPDPSKIEWKGNSSVGSALVRQLYGSDKGSLNDFIDLDPYDTKTKKRGNANRSARFKSGLEYIRDNFDNLFTSFTDSDKATALEGINSALSAFENGTVEDNEYLDLGRATGMSNLRDMFFAGEKYGSTTQTPGTTPTPRTGGDGVYTNENDWRSAKYPRLNTQVVAPIHLTDPNKYGNHSRMLLDRHLNTLSKDDLFDIVRSITIPNLYNHPKLRDKAASWSHVPFSNKYIVLNTLKVLKDKGYLDGYADASGNNFYIAGSYNKRRGTGLVWNMGKNTISETNIYDIPWWVTKMHNEFTAQVLSNKNGGSLRKFLTGGTPMSRFLNYLKLGVTNTFDFANNPDNWDSAFNFDKIISEINSGNGFSINGLNLIDTLNTLSSSTLDFSRNKANTGYKDWNVLYNTTGLNKFFGWDESKADAKGMSTYNRGALLKLLINTYNSPDKLLKIGGSNVYYSDGKWQLANNPVENTTQATEDAANARKAVVASTLLPGAKTAEELFGPAALEDKLDEKTLPPVEENVKTNNWLDIIPVALRIGKLFDSLNTNRRVYNTVLPSLKPVLKDTYERYSPVTGAFGVMLLKNRQGADVLRQSNKAFTSDASLAAARMFEGQRQANQLQAEGFLADNQEIKRTQAEALARLEDNMARRSEVANFNRASINQTNRERAQLKASRLKSDYLSREGFYNENINDIISRLTERRTLSNNFREQIATDAANRWYNNVMEQANREKDAWIRTHTVNGVVPDITTGWDKYTEYDNYRRQAEDMRTAMLRRDLGRIYNIGYSSPYTDESYNVFSRKLI